jgi:branched-chain amino acid transport system permease protein
VAIGLVPLAIANTFYLRILILVALNLILVTGLNLLMGQAGQISLGQAAFFGIGAYASALFVTKGHLSFWLALPLAALISGMVAFLIGMPTLKLKGHYLAMATLGFGEIVYILLLQLRPVTGGPDGIIGIPAPAIGKILLDTPATYYYLVWAVALLLFFIALNITRSRVGRALRALHESETAAAATGIDTSRYKVKIFVLCGMYGGIAGSLYAHYISYINPETFVITLSVVLVTMVVVGGAASVWGAFVGASILTILPEYLRAYQDFSLVFYGSILILVMIFMPQGIVPAIVRWYQRLKNYLTKGG